jgi:hypothetical protein
MKNREAKIVESRVIEPLESVSKEERKKEAIKPLYLHRYE